jgi:hypothetical protein
MKNNLPPLPIRGQKDVHGNKATFKKKNSTITATANASKKQHTPGTRNSPRLVAMSAAVATVEAGEANSTSAVYKIAVEDGDDALLAPIFATNNIAATPTPTARKDGNDVGDPTATQNATVASTPTPTNENTPATATQNATVAPTPTPTNGNDVMKCSYKRCLNRTEGMQVVDCAVQSCNKKKSCRMLSHYLQ